jgi:hypothetical protein
MLIQKKTYLDDPTGKIAKQAKEKQHLPESDDSPKPLLRPLVANDTMTLSDKLTRLEKIINKIIQKFKYLDHHFEVLIIIIIVIIIIIIIIIVTIIIIIIN